MNTNVDDGRETSSNSVGCLAEIVTLTGFLDILEYEGSVNNLDIGLDLGVELSVILRLVSCNKIKKTFQSKSNKTEFYGILRNNQD